MKLKLLCRNGFQSKGHIAFGLQNPWDNPLIRGNHSLKFIGQGSFGTQVMSGNIFLMFVSHHIDLCPNDHKNNMGHLPNKPNHPRKSDQCGSNKTLSN